MLKGTTTGGRSRGTSTAKGSASSPAGSASTAAALGSADRAEVCECAADAAKMRRCCSGGVAATAAAAGCGAGASSRPARAPAHAACCCSGSTGSGGAGGRGGRGGGAANPQRFEVGPMPSMMVSGGKIRGGVGGSRRRVSSAAPIWRGGGSVMCHRCGERLLPRGGDRSRVEPQRDTRRVGDLSECPPLGCGC